MRLRELVVPGAYELLPERHADDRGELLEWFRADRLAAALGRPVPVAQANLSVSRRGVLRGIHYADVPPGQGKVVTCVAGAVIDAVVDLRQGSPAFGRSETVRLDAERRTAVWVPEGVGHGFLAVAESATVAYLCTSPYTPSREHAVHPLSAGVEWPEGAGEPLLSTRDAAAPSLAEAGAAGLLPSYADCLTPPSPA